MYYLEYYQAHDNHVFFMNIMRIMMTTCAQDIITDLNAESEILPLEPVNEDWKGHKVQKSTHPGYCVFVSPFK